MDQTLHGWMQAVAPVRAPGRLLEETFGRTVATGQARDLPWRGITVAPRRRVLGRPAGWIAVGVAVALVGSHDLRNAGCWASRDRPSVPARAQPASASPSPSSSPSPPPSGPPPIVVAPQATIALQKPLALASDGRALWVAHGCLDDRPDRHRRPTRSGRPASSGRPATSGRASPHRRTRCGSPTGTRSFVYRIDPRT